MTMFGIREAVVAPLVRAIADRDLDSSEVRERFARATWTGIAEPGDAMAGQLVEAIGASLALESLVSRWSMSRVLAALADAGAEPFEPAQLQTAFDRWRPRLVSKAAVTAVQEAARLGAHLLVPGHPLWPAGVDDLGPHAPLALWMRGTPEAALAVSRSVALVGARAATGYGEHVAMEASAGLVDRGYSIVSGAAYGIDGMAHRAALASDGMTVAFLAGGVDRFYPSGHDALLTRIVATGAVISELPCGAPPTKWRFLQRNRLIAASSLATIVLEAGWRSGSLNTAGHAASLGRPLGAVPGPITSAASTGCHRLIREFDATLVTTAEEMAELAGPLGEVSAAPSSQRGPELSPAERGRADDERRVLDALVQRRPRDVADLAARSGLAEREVRAAIGMLALDGSIGEREGGWVRLPAQRP